MCLCFVQSCGHLYFVLLYYVVKSFHAWCFHGFITLQVCLWCSRCCWLPCCVAREGGCHGQYTRERTSHTWHWYCRPLENQFKHSHGPTHAHSEHQDMHISHRNTQLHTRRHMLIKQEKHIHTSTRICCTSNTGLFITHNK